MRETVRQRVLARGIVQGVFFRESTKRAASEAGTSGWVRNLLDGRVEAVFEGSKDAVDRMVDFCRSGPPGARVDQLDVFDETPEGLTGFTVRLTPPRDGL